MKQPDFELNYEVSYSLDNIPMLLNELYSFQSFKRLFDQAGYNEQEFAQINIDDFNFPSFVTIAEVVVTLVLHKNGNYPPTYISPDNNGLLMMIVCNSEIQIAHGNELFYNWAIEKGVLINPITKSLLYQAWEHKDINGNLLCTVREHVCSARDLMNCYHSIVSISQLLSDDETPLLELFVAIRHYCVEHQIQQETIMVENTPIIGDDHLWHNSHKLLELEEIDEVFGFGKNKKSCYDKELNPTSLKKRGLFVRGGLCSGNGY